MLQQCRSRPRGHDPAIVAMNLHSCRQLPDDRYKVGAGSGVDSANLVARRATTFGAGGIGVVAVIRSGADAASVAVNENTCAVSAAPCQVSPLVALALIASGAEIDAVTRRWFWVRDGDRNRVGSGFTGLARILD